MAAGTSPQTWTIKIGKSEDAGMRWIDHKRDGLGRCDARLTLYDASLPLSTQRPICSRDVRLCLNRRRQLLCQLRTRLRPIPEKRTRCGAEQ